MLDEDEEEEGDKEKDKDELAQELFEDGDEDMDETASRADRDSSRHPEDIHRSQLVLTAYIKEFPVYIS